MTYDDIDQTSVVTDKIFNSGYKKDRVIDI